MGACVSTHHKASAMKVHVSSGSDCKPHNHLLIHPSPTKGKPPIINDNVAVKAQWPSLHSVANSRDFDVAGSKEETFFDSQAWLESDHEDDFLSVNGEFTPSRGNTPLHHNFSAGTPPVMGGAATVDERKPSPDPTKKRMRLSDLFSESLRRENIDVQHQVVGNLEGVGVHGGGLKPKRERWVEVVHMHGGCLPSLVSICRPQQTQLTRKRV